MEFVDMVNIFSKARPFYIWAYFWLRLLNVSNSGSPKSLRHHGTGYYEFAGTRFARDDSKSAFPDWHRSTSAMNRSQQNLEFIGSISCPFRVNKSQQSCFYIQWFYLCHETQDRLLTVNHKRYLCIRVWECTVLVLYSPKLRKLGFIMIHASTVLGCACLFTLSSSSWYRFL